MAGPSWRRPYPEPLHATPRNESYRSDGDMVEVVAEALGTPFMPWQSLVAQVAGERLPGGGYRYPIVVVSVPRQSGKTTLMRARAVTRCLMQRGTQTFYTAQTGKDARERWRDLCKQIVNSPLRSQVDIKQAAGSERLEFANGSEFRVFAPVPAALHGYTPPEVHLDEAWAHDTQRGEELLGAIVPAQITITDRQLWIVSTAGTMESGFFRQWVDAALADADGVAGFVWAAPDGADPYDPQVWESFHPALGHTITADDLAAAASAHTRPEFERAYCNRWTRTASAIIPADLWAELAEAQTPPAGGVALAYDVAHDRTSADIVACWETDGIRHLHVVRTEAGWRWVPDALDDLRHRLGADVVIGADSAGPVLSVTEHVPGVRLLSTAEYATACGEFLADVHGGLVRHDGTDRLADAAASVVTRPMSDMWGWSRRNSAGTVSAITAATIAAWLVRHRPPPTVKPFIVGAAR